MYVSGEAKHQHRILARYRSLRKDRQIVGYEIEWIQLGSGYRCGTVSLYGIYTEYGKRLVFVIEYVY